MKRTLLLFAVAATLITIVALPTRHAATRTKNHFEEDRREAYDALNFFNTARAFPYNDIPDSAYANAFAFYKKNYLHAPSRSSSSWQNIGPANVGGRTIGIAIDPVDTNVVWLGSASGGLWRSTTGGVGFNAWTYVPTGFPVLGVSCIAIDPTNHNTMYIGTGETYSDGSSSNGLVNRVERGTYGIGILKTTDGGNTWTQSLNWIYQQNRGVWDLVINPKNTNIIYAATTEGVFKTPNAGGSWTNVLQRRMVMDLEIDKVDTNILYAGVGNLQSPNKGLYKTMNSGAAWNILTGGLPPNTQDGRITITAYPANNKILMCEVANAFSTVGIYRSTNEGVNWTSVNNNLTNVADVQGWYAKCLAMKADDSSKVLVGGVDLFYSEYSGNWLNQIDTFTTFWLHPDYHGIVTNPKDPNKIYLINDGGLFRSNNFGQTFYDCNDGYVTSQSYIGSVSVQDSLMMLNGLQDNNTQFLYSTPYWYAVLGGDGSYNAIDPNDDMHQLASWQYLNIAERDGTSGYFNPVYSPVYDPTGGAAAAFIAPLEMCRSNSNVVYGGDTVLIKSQDGGTSWLPVTTQPVDNDNKLLCIAASHTNSDSIYYATAPTTSHPMHMFRSINGGVTQTDISTGLPNRYPRRIAMNPHNSRELYCVFSGFNTGHVFKSTNAGATWSDLSASLPNIPFHCVVVDPLNTQHVYVGCDFGVFESDDGGGSWAALTSGMPDEVMVFDLVISPSDRHLLAFTHGRGVYKYALGKIFAGTNSLHANQSLAVYPNPANTFVEIKSPRSDDVNIYNSQGMRVKHFTSSNAPLDVRDLPNGMYLIEAELHGQRRVSKLAVIH